MLKGLKDLAKAGNTVKEAIKNPGQAAKNGAKLGVNALGKSVKNAAKMAIKTVLKTLAPILFKIVVVVLLVIIVVSVLAGVTSLLRDAISEGQVDMGMSDDLLMAYLHAWENEDGPSTSSDGKNYIVESDGGGGAAVGYGVDIAAHGDEIRAAGYSTSIGSEIPVDFVDELEKTEIDACKQVVEEATEGLNLQEYQKHALISRVYNCGSGGWEDHAVNSGPFADAYKTYWKSTDLNYGRKASEEMFDSSLYTNYLKKPNTAGGSYNQGVQNRRDSEWVLFKTGFYGYGRSKEEVQVFYYDYVKVFDTGYGNWDGSGNTFGINIIVGGHVNEDNMTKLRKALEDYYGLPHITQPIDSSGDVSVSQRNIRKSTGYAKYDYTKVLEPAQCVWWAYVRSNQYLSAYGKKYKSIDEAKKYVKVTRGGTYGNGCMWGERYSQVFNSGKVPKTNSLFSYGSGVGHVGYVEAVDGKYMYITHCGSGKYWRGLDKVLISTFNQKHSPTYVYLTEPK